MHRLFQMYRNFGGALFETKDDDGNDCVAIRFNSLMLMQSWFQRYEKYEEDVQKADKIENVNERKEALEKAYREFDWWMDTYPIRSPSHIQNLSKPRKSTMSSWIRWDSTPRIQIDNLVITGRVS